MSTQANPQANHPQIGVYREGYSSALIRRAYPDLSRPYTVLLLIGYTRGH
jgi:hypothetical protein